MSSNVWAVLVLIALGAMLLWCVRKPARLLGLLLAGVGTLLPFLTLELLLRLGFMSESRVWRPPPARSYDQRITRLHERVATRHPFQFNDRCRSPACLEGKYSLAVLGDSFVWGDGVKDEDRWSRKLERKIAAGGFEVADRPVRVLHWGRRGWSTLDQVKFLEKLPQEWRVDFLVVGFVTNDPDVGAFKQRYFKWHLSPAVRRVQTVLPYCYAFITDYVNQFLYERSSEYGYGNWLDKLYTASNLKRYRGVLRRLKRWSEQRQVPLLMVLTPNDYNESFRARYDQVIPLLDQVGIEYLDLLPTVQRDLAGIPSSKLKANRADGHPGALVTEVYAQHVLATLRTALLNGMPKQY